MIVELLEQDFFYYLASEADHVFPNKPLTFIMKSEKYWNVICPTENVKIKKSSPESEVIELFKQFILRCFVIKKNTNVPYFSDVSKIVKTFRENNIYVQFKFSFDAYYIFIYDKFCNEALDLLKEINCTVIF